MSSLRAQRRHLIATLVVLFLGVASGRAHATVLGGGTIEMDILLPDGDGDYVEVSDLEIAEFFNMAHCQCIEETFAVKLQLVGATGSTEAKPVEIWVGNGCDAWALDERTRYCVKLDGYDDPDDLLNPQKYEIPAHVFMFPPVESSLGCEPKEGSNMVYAWIDDDNTADTVFEDAFAIEVFFDTKPPPLPSEPLASPGERAIVVDWDTPTSSEEDVFQYQVLCARVGENNPVDELPRDDPEYQISKLLCDIDDGTQLGASSSSADVDAGVPADAMSIVDAGIDAGPTFDAGPIIDAGPTVDAEPIVDAGPTFDADPSPDAGSDLASKIHGLSNEFVCGTASSTETSIRVTGLENGVAYHVGLLSIDEAQNVTGIYLGTVTPTAVTDFWEDYHDRGGNADGGICLINSTYGDSHPFTTALRDFRDNTLARFAVGRALIELYYEGSAPLARLAQASWVARVVFAVALTPVVIAVAVWEYTGPVTKLLLLLGLLWLRRRRWQPSRAVLATATTALLLAVVSSANAQPLSPSPYWERYDEPLDSYLGPPELKWNFEFKLGPYMPNVDDEFGDDAVGPFENMFGDSDAIMGIIELQRFFLWPAGQLGVGVSLGVMGKTAHAFLEEVGEDGELRSEGDKTSFRLMPTAISAVYRFTELDDRWSIPIIPYGKVGLSYYLWWITDPNGSFARVPVSEDCTDIYDNNCDTDRALGASIGWQAALGLSIRAERIDKQAAMNLRNEMNIEHAGFFVELLYAKVDHFGANDRLKVGDFTWFGGISFEF